MIKISKKTQYGLRAMVQLAKARGILSVKEISRKEGISFEFLEKIVLKLEKAGLVESKKGVLGGYSLARPASKINANDIVSALDDNKNAVDCVFCGRKKSCASKGVWSRLEDSVSKTLKKITLAKLV